MNLLTDSRITNPSRAEPIIQLDNVSVQYRLPQERVTSFKDYAIRRLKGTLAYREFWALRNINLTVQRGEVLGIVGPNGAGKSTLLKVIARVIRPTEGRVRVRGRVAPLLELGTGFDHELTGRENVYLNSAMLGYSRRDTEGRVERIVAFAGIGEFIDAPLRTYSSGMVARLGFSIATDVEPSILIVDEVLAVGDAEFKRGSSDRIKKFQQKRVTILLVSHNLESINSLCQRAVWLEHGVVKEQGAVSEVIAKYDRGA